MIVLLKKYWVVLFLLIIIIVYAFPYVFYGKVPFPTSYIANNIGPWNKYLNGGPVKNGIPDVPGEIYPMRSLVIDFWKSGTIPLWNPYIFSGTPLLANFQSAVFFPLNLIFFLLPKVHAWSLLVLLQPLLAFVFVYFYMRFFKLSKISSVFSAVSFMFCGFLTVWGSYATMGFAVVFLPLILLFIEKYLQNNKNIYLPLITFALATSFFSGHIQTWFYVVGAVIIYLLIKALSENTIGRKKLLLLFIYIFLAIPLVTIQFLPTAELYTLSSRLLMQNTNAAGIPFFYILTSFVPDFFGNPVTRNDWFGTYAEWSSYAGLTALVLAVLAISNIFKEKKIAPIFTVGCVSLIIALQNPLLDIIAKSKIPILSNSNPSRAIVLFSFAISILSGFGFEMVRKNFHDVKRNLFKIITFFSLLLLVFLLAALLGKTIFSPDIANNLRQVSFRNLLLPYAIIAAVWLIYFILLKKQKFKSVIIVGLLMVLVFEMLRFYKKWTPFDAINDFYPQTSVSLFLGDNPETNRFYGQFTQTPAYINHLFSPEGYEPLNLLSYGNLISAIDDGNIKKTYNLEVKLQSQEKYSKKILDILGVKYLIYDANDARNSFVFPVWKLPEKLYPLIFNDHKYLVVENSERLPRVKLFSKYQVMVNESDAVKTLLSDSFDFKNTLMLDKNPGISESALSTGSAAVSLYESNKVGVKTNNVKSSMLFISDNYYPGWKAFINDHPVQIMKADYAFRAVVVPPGENFVIFKYEPDSFRYGVVISGITLFLLIVSLSTSFWNDKLKI